MLRATDQSTIARQLQPARCARFGATPGLFIKVGAAAGIATAFNTPIAAITFGMEEVIGDLNQRLVGAIVVASVAAVVERVLQGGKPSLLVPPTAYAW